MDKGRKTIQSFFSGLIFLLLMNGPAAAFATLDEQIAHYLEVLDNGSYAAKTTMLERLQWSGLSDPRLYDQIESRLLADYQKEDLNKNDYAVMSHQARALSYSGNEKYRKSLKMVMKQAANKRVAKHARKALSQLKDFSRWQKLIEQSSANASAKEVEVASYMRMLNVDDVFVQRLAARAIYHEEQNDPDLLALTADKLKAIYAQEGLDKQEQDTAAWLCKALGQSGIAEYGQLLTRVADETPYKKIRKYAVQYAQ